MNNKFIINTQLLTSCFLDNFLVADISEMLELLAGLGISVIPVCFTNDRNIEDSNASSSSSFLGENIVVEYSRTNKSYVSLMSQTSELKTPNLKFGSLLSPPQTRAFG